MSPSPATRRSATIVSTGVGRVAALAVGVVVLAALGAGGFLLAGPVVLPLSGAAALLLAVALLVLDPAWWRGRVVAVVAVIAWVVCSLLFWWSSGVGLDAADAGLPAPAAASATGPSFLVGSAALLVALVALGWGLLRHRRPRRPAPGGAPVTGPGAAGEAGAAPRR